MGEQLYINSHTSQAGFKEHSVILGMCSCEIASSTHPDFNLATCHPIPSAALKALSKGEYIMHVPSNHQGNLSFTNAQSSGSGSKRKCDASVPSDTESDSLPSPSQILDTRAKKKCRTAARAVTRGMYFSFSPVRNFIDC